MVVTDLIVEANMRGMLDAFIDFRLFFENHQFTVTESNDCISACYANADQISLKSIDCKYTPISILGSLELKVEQANKVFYVGFTDVNHPFKPFTGKYKYDDLTDWLIERDFQTKKWLEEVSADPKISIGYSTLSKYDIGGVACSFSSYDYLVHRFSKK